MKRSQKRLNNKLLRNLDLAKTLLNAGLTLAVTINITGFVFASPGSNNLPIPNYIDGANLKYSSGLNINSNTGSLDSTIQTNATNAANKSCKLNVDLGTTANSIADMRYNSFNIGKGKTVNFIFGASGQAALNRVTQVGDQYASKILGNITQSGKGGAVFLINPNGVLFGAKSKINVNSFTVSTLDLVPDNSLNPLTLSRGSFAPKGILFKKGAQINASKGAVFAANGILDKGANITSPQGNVQMIVGDGVTVNYSSNYAADQVQAEDIVPSTVIPNQVIYPDGKVNKNNAISIKSGTIKGNNIEIVARINNTLISSLPQIVNIDGIIKANKVNNSGGSILVLADNSAGTGTNNAVGIKVNTNLNAPADIQLQANQIVAKDITAERNLMLFGDNIKTYKLRAGENVFIAQSVFDSSLSPALSTVITNINAGNDIGLASQSGSIGNLTAGNNIDISSLTSSGQTLNIGKIKAGKDISVTADGIHVNTGNIYAGNNANLTAFDDGGILRAGNVTAGNDASITSSSLGQIFVKNVNTQGNVLIGGFNVAAAGAGNIKAKGNVTISSLQGGVSIGDICANSVQVEAGDVGTASTGNIKAAKDVNISAGFDSSTTTGNINAGNDAIINADSNGTVTSRNINAGRDVSVIADIDGAVNVKDINAGRNVLVGGFNTGRTSTGDIQAKGDVSLSSAEGFVSVGNVCAGNDVIFDEFLGNINVGNIKAEGNLTAGLLDSNANTGNITLGGNLNLDLTGAAFTTGNIKVGENLTAMLDLSSSLNTGNICVGHDLTAELEFSILNTGNISAGNNVEIKAFGETITLKDVSAGGNILISEAQGATILGNIKAGSSATLSTSEGPLTAGNIKAGLDATVTAIDNSTLKIGDIDAGRNIALNSLLDSNITTKDISAGNDVTLNKPEGSTITTGKISAGGEIITTED